MWLNGGESITQPLTTEGNEKLDGRGMIWNREQLGRVIGSKSYCFRGLVLRLVGSPRAMVEMSQWWGKMPNGSITKGFFARGRWVKGQLCEERDEERMRLMGETTHHSAFLIRAWQPTKASLRHRLLSFLVWLCSGDLMWPTFCHRQPLVPYRLWITLEERNWKLLGKCPQGHDLIWNELLVRHCFGRFGI